MDIKSFKSLTDFLDYFKDEKTCREYFTAVRFREGEYCPHCGHTKIYTYSKGKRFRCSKCHQDFTIKTNTIFGDSKLPLRKWFVAIYLLTTNKKGISSIQLSNQVGVTQKTAWFMDHRIREALKQGKGLLSDKVEIDETYIGGKESNKHKNKRQKGTQGRNTDTKTPIVGLIQRKGQVRANVTDDVKMKTLEQQLVSNVKLGSQVYSDDFLSYSRVGSLFPHQAVAHGRGEYVKGDSHTNSIESFWALFKRGYYGTYHNMSRKHLQRYVTEFVYRFNQRGNELTDVFSDVVSRITDNKQLGYNKLTNG